MVILFTGHRNKTCHPDALANILSMYPGAVWLHGGAIGFDSQVESFARSHGVETIVMRPDYARLGRSAPLRRNDDMLSRCDLVVACYDGRQSGRTFYTVNKARALGKQVILIPAISGTGA